MRRLAIASAACAALLAVSATAASGFAVTYARGPDPAVSRWPDWPYATGCLGVEFDPAVFGGATEAEKGSGGPEQALRRYLEEGLYPQLPTSYWRQVSSSPGRVSFASGRLELGLFWLTTGEIAPGQWAVVGNVEECNGRSLRSGESAIDWALAPKQRLGPRTRRIEVALRSSGGCDGGPSYDSAAEPFFQQLGGRLVLTIWLRPLPPGAHDCKKRKEGPLSVRLPSPLGKRQLWNGVSYPPRRIR